MGRHFISGTEDLLCESCGCLEDVLVLPGQRQGCEMEEGQQIVVLEDAPPPAVTILLSLQGKCLLLLDAAGQSDVSARPFSSS